MPGERQMLLRSVHHLGRGLALVTLLVSPLAAASDGEPASPSSPLSLTLPGFLTTPNSTLEVEVYPTPVPDEGYLVDGIIRTSQGTYLLYTGWYFHGVRAALEKSRVPICCKRPRR